MSTILPWTIFRTNGRPKAFVTSDDDQAMSKSTGWPIIRTGVLARDRHEALRVWRAEQAILCYALATRHQELPC